MIALRRAFAVLHNLVRDEPIPEISPRPFDFERERTRRFPVASLRLALHVDEATRLSAPENARAALRLLEAMRVDVAFVSPEAPGAIGIDGLAAFVAAHPDALAEPRPFVLALALHLDEAASALLAPRAQTIPLTVPCGGLADALAEVDPSALVVVHTDACRRRVVRDARREAVHVVRILAALYA